MRLNKAQLELVAKLTDPDCPSPAAVRAEVGTGVGGAIERVIEIYVRSTSVLLIVPNFNVLVEQWTWRLQQVEGIRAVQQLSVPLALEMLDHGVPGAGSVVVAKVMDLRRPLAQRLLNRWSPGLLIIDDASSQARLALGDGSDVGSQSQQLLQFAMTCSRRVILVARSQQVMDGIPIVAELSRSKGPEVAIRRFAFNIPADELALMRAAGAFSQQNSVKNWSDLPDTRPMLMDRLLKIATAKSTLGDDGKSPESSEEETSWGYIDALEHLGEDHRLTALDRAIDASDHGLVLVVAPSFADLDYVVQHLESTRGSEVQKVSRRDAAIQWSRLATDDSGHKIIAATPSVLRSFSLGSEAITLIIWSRELQVRDQLADFLQGAGNSMYVVVLEPRDP